MGGGMGAGMGAAVVDSASTSAVIPSPALAVDATVAARAFAAVVVVVVIVVVVVVVVVTKDTELLPPRPCADCRAVRTVPLLRAPWAAAQPPPSPPLPRLVVGQ